MSWQELPETEERSYLPTVLPVGWYRIPGGQWEGHAFERSDGLCVISSACREGDGKRWIHVSASRQNRLPTWADLRDVKNLFIGRDRLAIQVLPREEDYYNFHPYCLHLYSCVDGDPVPDFRKDGAL